MKETDLNQEFEALRRGFDAVDQQLIQLLSNRFELSVKIGNIKEQLGLATEDPSRESAIIENIKGRIEDVGLSQAIIQVYQVILNQSKLLQSAREETSIQVEK